MLPFQIIQVVPELAASIMFSAAVKRFIDKRLEPIIDETAKDVVKKVTENINKPTENSVSDVVSKKKEIVSAVVNRQNSEENLAKKRYCDYLFWLYGKFEDDDILKFMVSKGCITEEDYKEIMLIDKEYNKDEQ